METQAQNVNLQNTAEENSAGLPIQLPSSITLETAPEEVKALAKEFINDLLSPNTTGTQKIVSLDQFGEMISGTIATNSSILEEKMKTMKKLEETKEFADTVLNLNQEIEKINPEKLDLGKRGFMGGVAKLFSFIPGVGKKVEKYWLQFEKSGQVIDTMMTKVDEEIRVQTNDALIMQTQKEKMITDLKEFIKVIQCGMLISQELENRIEVLPDDATKRAAKEQWLIPFNMRLNALQKIYTTKAQSVVATEVILTNQRSMLDQIKNQKIVTRNLLETGVMLAANMYKVHILQNLNTEMKKTNDKIQNFITKSLGSQTAETIRQLDESISDQQKFRNAFYNVVKNLQTAQDASIKALPKMKEALLQFEELTKESDQILRNIEARDANMKKMDDQLPNLLAEVKLDETLLSSDKTTEK